MNGLPWWVKGIATVGFPIAITAFLLAQSAGWIPSEVSAMNDTLKERRSNFDQHVQETKDLVQSIKLAAKIMCENAARDDTQRRHCENIR